jgi:hypothetical protein
VIELIPRGIMEVFLLLGALRLHRVSWQEGVKGLIGLHWGREAMMCLFKGGSRDNHSFE